MLAFLTGRYSMAWAGEGGFWECDGRRMVLRPDPGHRELVLERTEHGYGNREWRLIRSEAEFLGFWPEFDPLHPIDARLLRLPVAITSTWRGIERAGLVISGENARVGIEAGIGDEGDPIVWNHGGRSGRAAWFFGTPRIDHPQALHVPHLYDYWARLGERRPSRSGVRPVDGISWVASYAEGGGDLTQRRLEVAKGLARWFPLALAEGLKGAFEGIPNVSFHRVSWTLLGKI